MCHVRRQWGLRLVCRPPVSHPFTGSVFRIVPVSGLPFFLDPRPWRFTSKTHAVFVSCTLIPRSSHRSPTVPREVPRSRPHPHGVVSLVRGSGRVWSLLGPGIGLKWGLRWTPPVGLDPRSVVRRRRVCGPYVRTVGGCPDPRLDGGTSDVGHWNRGNRTGGGQFVWSTAVFCLVQPT